MFGAVAQLHLRIIRSRTTVVLILIDDAGVAGQILTGGLEICHSFCGEDRDAMILWCSMVAFMDWDSGVDNGRSYHLFLDDWLNGLMNFLNVSKESRIQKVG
jgi:hypothetical protein